MRKFLGRGAVAGAFAFGGSVAASELPDGFSLSTIATGLNQPIALACAPDGRIFVCEKEGAVRVIDAAGNLLPEPFIELSVHTFSECGLLAIELSPSFATDGYIYLFATVLHNEQQILRLRDVNNRADEPTVIRGFIPTSGANHNGGGLRFGPDGMLYFSVGDAQEPDSAQNIAQLSGKIVRITPDGDTPADNPFITSSGAPRAAYALGFRNPFRFDIAPDGRLFVLDVGSDNPERREEINIIRAGNNAGWPLVEGEFDPAAYPGLVGPAFSYNEAGSAPTGALFYTGTQFPPEYVGNFFHFDFVSNRMFRAVLDGDRVVSHSQFFLADGGPVDLVQAPDGSVYFCELINGAVRKISYGSPIDGQSGPDEPTSNDDPSNANGADDAGDDDGASDDEGAGGGLASPCAALPLGLIALSAVSLRRRRE